MSDKPKIARAVAILYSRRTRTLGAAFLTLAVAGCFSGGLTSRDYSTFQTYRFEQTAGLGFCGDKDRVFSAEISRQPDGTMAFKHSVLALAGPDPEKCEDGVAAEGGCFRPKALPSRPLNSQETDRVSTIFADVDYHRSPDRICRQIAFDPCMIERHTWDTKALSDYICGNDRLSNEKSTEISKLLSDLRARG